MINKACSVRGAVIYININMQTEITTAALLPAARLRLDTDDRHRRHPSPSPPCVHITIEHFGVKPPGYRDLVASAGIIPMLVSVALVC